MLSLLSFANSDQVRTFHQQAFIINSFIQFDKKRGYSIGAEYHYDLFNKKDDESSDELNYTLYDDDVEEMQREQEEEYNQFTSFYNTFDYNNSREREQYQFKIGKEKIVPTTTRTGTRLESYLKIIRYLLSTLDMKYIYGILKCHLQKPYPTVVMDSGESVQEPFNVVLMNYLSFIFGRYKISTNFGYHTKFKHFITKLMMRRKFYISKLARQLYLSLSVMNFHNMKRFIYGVSASLKGYSLQVRSNMDLDVNVSLTKRGLLWSPFSEQSQQNFLQYWKDHYENQEIFSKIELPPPPKIDSYLWPELRILPRGDEMLHWVNAINHMRNILVQFSKILRYFVDLQVSTAETSIRGLFTSTFHKNIYHYLSSKFFEQLYLFSVGFRCRWTIEYGTNLLYEGRDSLQDDNDQQSIQKQQQQQNISDEMAIRKKQVRIPIELDWGCEWFRLWCFVDVTIDVQDQYRSWMDILKMNWHQTTLTLCITLLDVYTLFSRTWSLSQLLFNRNR